MRARWARGRRVRLGRSWALVLALALLFVAPAPASAAQAPWRSAAEVGDGLRDAALELVLEDHDRAAGEVRRAGRAYAGRLRGGVHAADPGADRDIRRALAQALRAARAGDELGLASAAGTARAGLLRGAYAATLAAVERGDADAARTWLLLRDFRTATRFTRPGADATVAVERLAAGRIDPRGARTAVAKDLLDAYQSRVRELLDEGAQAGQRGFGTRRAEAAGRAAGLWRILGGRYREDRGAGAADAAARAFAHLDRAAAQDDDRAYATNAGEVARALDGFTAAPFTPREAARRAQQLVRFLALVPVEYDRGVSGDRVTLDFEIQEAVAFQTGGAAAFTDLEAQLGRRDPRRTAAVEADLEELRALVTTAARQPVGVAPAERVQAVTDRAQANLGALFPPAWKEQTDESDYDLIELTLDRMESAVGAGEYDKAEQARLEAYAFFEFGPERRLKAFDPGLALDVEGLVWFGARDRRGLAQLIAERAPRREVRQTRLALDEGLDDAAATLGDGASRATVVTNSAILVFREGLEAVLILAAITASFVGVRRRLRRPVLIGAVLGLLVSLVTWVLAQTLLRSLDQYGERLEAVVGLVAIAVLLLITNWFFHRVYWSQWIGRFHRQRRRIEGLERRGFVAAQAIGLGLLGLTSVYREGFETVLFLQSLQLSAGTAAVVEGAGLGLALTLAVAVVVFALERKLPYKKMLIVTGVLIGVVLITMTGQTARTMQGTGWLSITAIDVDLPYWLGLWFGVFPTWETVAAQLLAAAFVIGSYLLAQEVKVKRPRRRARRGEVAAAPVAGGGLEAQDAPPAAPPQPVAGGTR